MTHRTLLIGLGLLVVSLVRPAAAQFDEEADLIPGLVVTFNAGDRSIERIDADLSYNWGTAAPDPRLPAGPFEATWSSGLLLREEGTYTFSAYLQGALRVEVDGEVVLDASKEEPGWVSGDPIELDFGLFEFNVTFESNPSPGGRVSSAADGPARSAPGLPDGQTRPPGSARMQLFWSSDQFPLEPIPPHQIFREEGRPDLALIETGRQQFAAHRCNRCHVRENAPTAPPAPGLFHVTSGLNRHWLKAKLLDQNPEAAHAKMPSFGFSHEEAEAIAAWIEYLAQPADLMTAARPKRPRGDDAPSIEEEGEKLLHSIGCLACHQVGDLGHSGPFGGGDLSHIGAKRTADWITTWLSRPERLNAQHRMPVFKLSSNERALLTATLASLGRDEDAFDEIEPDAKQETELVKRGRELAKAARCAACHKIPAMEADLTGVPTLSQTVKDWDNSCLVSPDRATSRPFYPRVEADAIQAYLESRTGELSPPDQFARGRHVLEERNCLGCHERELTKGIVPIAGSVAAQIESLRGQSEALIPPALTAVGDKLYEEPLAIAVSGKQKQVRLPWLQVRMPRFVHSDHEKQALVDYLIGHDRIPERTSSVVASPGRQPGDASQPDETSSADRTNPEADAPGSPTDASSSSVDPQTLLIGRTLAGSGGFNCVACHAFGDYQPRNVALGTKGSDLKQIGQRMREEYFHRWTRDPLRVVPGMEMPSIKRPVPGVLDGDLDKQLAAVWAAINDPDFTAPPNPAQVEQHIVLQPGDPPRIIRDVFTVSEANGGGYVARGIAMGFDNGHSLLFDVDNFCVRGWTFGDFAQQRTEGKSWYWDLAGVDLMEDMTPRPEVSLRTRVEELFRTDRSNEEPATDASPSLDVLLLSYEVDGDSVVVDARVTLTTEDDVHTAKVRQTFEAIDSRRFNTTGIRRTVEITGDEDRLLALNVPDRHSETGHITTPAIRDRSNAASGSDVMIHYTSRLSTPGVTPTPRPELPRNDAPVTTLPGFTGQRLKLPSSIMPTAIGWDADGQTVFTSLKGHVYRANDTDGDGIEDSLTTIEEGLAAPFGILPDGDSLLVVHKPELLRLTDTNGDGRADVREIVADGWGYTDNYHDWTTGPVRDAEGNLYLALGSDYQQNERPADVSLWRGKVLKVDLAKPRGERGSPFAHELRFPQGIAMDDRGRLFVTDQQGVANTFNEINHIVEGRHYGVEAMHEKQRDVPETRAAVQVPHPWTRSVNGLMFLPSDITGPLAPFAGHGIGAEYNSKFLIRFSLQEVDGELQGATYYFSRPTWEDEANTFLGPLAVALGPTGDLYVGSIHDSGWLGGQNTGEIVRLSPNGEEFPNGIRELRATPDGFEIEFLQPVDATKAKAPANYSLSGYTRVWEGSYATPDSGRYSPQIESIDVSGDGHTVRLSVDELRTSYVYELSCTGLDDSLLPATGHYTMNRIPK